MECKKDYQICELEEIPFGVFSVSAVPEDWIIKLEDGSLACIWPKENAGPKIRRQQHPDRDGGVWDQYKCRILMDGGNLRR